MRGNCGEREDFGVRVFHFDGLFERAKVGVTDYMCTLKVWYVVSAPSLQYHWWKMTPGMHPPRAFSSWLASPAGLPDQRETHRCGGKVFGCQAAHTWCMHTCPVEVCDQGIPTPPPYRRTNGDVHMRVRTPGGPFWLTFDLAPAPRPFPPS